MMQRSSELVGDGDRCPACGAAERATVFQSRGFPIDRCTGCGLVRTVGAPPADAAEYPPFDQRETVGIKLMREGVGLLLRERLSLVRQLKPQGRLLDFGCGSGSFARVAAQAGYQTVGVEPFSLGRPIEEPGLRLLQAPLASCASSLGRFDVITLWQVLEHLHQPEPDLERLIGLLEPDGLLLVSVPNFASWQSRVFGPGWFHLDPPRHVLHFTSETLKQLFARVGLTVVSERTFHLEYGPVGWVQSALNRALPRRNFLHEFVKDRGALAEVPAPEMWLNLSLSFVLGGALVIPSLVAELAAASVGAGSVVTLAARRARA